MSKRSSDWPLSRAPAPRALTRRTFLKRASSATLGLAAFPYIIPSSALGADGAVAPSERITMGCIGVGRMGSGNMRGFLGYPEVQVVAVCDIDAKRLENAKQTVEAAYAKRAGEGWGRGCATYHDFRDLCARDDIDATLICTPDHWHCLPAIAAAKSGKDIYLEKPLSFSIAEGRALSDAVRRHGRVFQTGSQQRSEWNFRYACELVRNGRIGKLHTVRVGLPTDPATGLRPHMPVPANLDYDLWLGPAPWAPYTEERVHPQNDYGRPGWLRMLDYGAGMITGWGAHHNDIAQWGMGAEYTGPVEIEGRGDYHREGLWDVHGKFHIEYTYANGVRLICTDTSENRQGACFEGDEGRVYVKRGVIDAEPKALLKSVIGPDEVHLYVSSNHKGNFLECIKTRRQTAAPAEIGHRSCAVCLLGSIAMQLGRKLRWDPDRERFMNDPEADGRLLRPMRPPWRI